MRTQSEDTSPEIERVQIELICKASPAKIFNLVRSMSQTMMQASRENIQRLHPGASKEELTLTFIELYYGKELANFVRAKMERRGGERKTYPPRKKTERTHHTGAGVPPPPEVPVFFPPRCGCPAEGGGKTPRGG